MSVITLKYCTKVHIDTAAACGKELHAVKTQVYTEQTEETWANLQHKTDDLLKQLFDESTWFLKCLVWVCVSDSNLFWIRSW